MALRDLVVLAILLSCLLVLHHVMEAIITDYTRVHIQRRRLLIEFTDAMRNKCPKKERRPRRFWIRKVANAFGLSRSCCSIIVRRVSSTVATHLVSLHQAAYNRNRCEGKDN